jgi:hypothetical protein
MRYRSAGAQSNFDLCARINKHIQTNGNAHKGQKRKRKMKKFNLGMSLLAIAVCAMLSLNPVKSYADQIVNLQLTGVQGTNTNGEDVYPYYASANGGASFSLMCLSFDNSMSVGESWTATVETISTTAQEEAAWLLNDAETAVKGNNTALQIADQWAAWELFSTNAANNANPPAGAATQLADAKADYASEPLSFYENFVLYAPEAGSQTPGYGTPQTFIGDAPASQTFNDNAPTPEPGSLILLGTGLLGLAAFMFRRKHLV